MEETATEAPGTGTEGDADGALWRAFALASPDVVLVVDREGTILYVNRIAPAFSGRTVVGRKIWEFTIDGAQERLQERLREAASGRPLRYEHPGLRPDGAPGWYEVQAVPLATGGTVERILWISRDITERRLAAEQLEQSERRIRALIEHGDDCITLISEDGRIRYASPATARSLGTTVEELVGSPAIDYLHPDDRASSGVLRLRDNPGQAMVSAIRLRRRDGTWRWHEGTTINLLHDPAVAAFVVNRRDVTEQRAVEQQLQQAQKMEAIGLLAGGVAHDFNNLLAVILGFSEVALRKLPPDHAVREPLAEVGEAARRGGELTHKLLAFSRKQIIQPRLLEVGATVAAFTRLIERVVGEDIELSIERWPEPLVVRADPVQLEQVLLNLCTNARQAMPEGGKLRVSMRMTEFGDAFAVRAPWARAGRYAEIEVADTGVGMDDTTRARVFEPFFTTKAHGTGLGLATVYGIVRQHGGFVHVESAPGEGATLRVLLPLSAGDTTAPQATPPARAQPDAGGGETLLVAEDEPALRSLLQIILRDLGYRVIAVADGKEALREFERARDAIDLVLLDVVMPGPGAREVCARLAEVRPGVRVLLMTGYAPESTGVSELIESGRLPLLEKPFSPAALAAKVRAVLQAGVVNPSPGTPPSG